MKQVASSDFRKTYTRETEAVEVMAYDNTLGWWVPADSEEARRLGLVDGAEEPVQQVAPPRMTIRPVKGESRVLLATEKRVIDPVEIREKVKAQERARYQDPQLGRRQSRLGRPG